MNSFVSIFLLWFIFGFVISNCPIGWYNYNSSCYKSYSPASYSNAMETCFKLLIRQRNIRRSHLVNIETTEELNFIGSLMIHENVSQIYIGANNIIKRSGVLVWEKLGSTAEVDRRFFCNDMEIDNSSYYCGYVNNKLVENELIYSNYYSQFINSNNDYNISIYKDKKFTGPLPIKFDTINNFFCINASDCFRSLPYLCEINCTNQEAKCMRWSEEYNQEFHKNVTSIFYNIINSTTPIPTSTTTTLTTKTSTTTTSSTTITTTITSTSTTSTTTSSTTEINPCLLKLDKCKNNSTCIFDKNLKNYHCLCLPGFEGFNCEKDERPCEPSKNRCINNSTCNYYGIGKFYNCTCQTGFEGYHCESNIDDCPPNICENGGICEDFINSYRCNCPSYYSGQFCEIKNQELVIKENVSRSFSFFAITFMIMTYVFFISLDTLRYVFKIEPEGLSQERNLIRKKKLIKKIVEDMRSKRKRKRYKKIISQNLKTTKDPIIAAWEETFLISYERDLIFIDDDIPMEMNENKIGLI